LSLRIVYVSKGHMKTIINLIVIKRVDKSDNKKFLLSKTLQVLWILSNFSSVQKLEKDSKSFI